MDKEINNNGFEYVDLGLPSGTLWATKNVGAHKPSDFGLYFQWGDTTGYTKEQIGYDEGKKKFIYDDYKWYLSGSQYDGSIKFKKYTIPGAALALEDDAAHVNMNGDWHMPMPEQIQELVDNTTNTWTTKDGVNGRLFTSTKDNSKTLFFPAAGSAWDGSVRRSGVYGDVWSSMLYTDNVVYGQDLIFLSDSVYLLDNSRYGGLSVRGVIG